MRLALFGRYLAQKKILTSYLFMFSFAIIVISGRLLFFGEKYGLNYGLYHPDSICYAKMAAEYANIKLSDLQQELSLAYSDNTLSKIGLLNCTSVSARVLYPILSAPFVRLIGLEGMLVVPIFSYLLALLLLARSIYKSRISINSTLIVISFVLMSTTISRWFIASLVDPLLITLNWGLLYLLINYKVFTNYRKLFLLCLIIIAMSLTKRSLHLVLICALVCLLLIYRSRDSQSREYSTKKVIGVLILLPITMDFIVGRIAGRQNGLRIVNEFQACIKGQTRQLCQSVVGVDAPERTPTKFDIIQDTVITGSHIILRYIFVSIAQIFVIDLPLAVTLIFWLYFTPRMYRNLTTLNAFALFSPILIILVSSFNGTIGLNFRFELACFFPIYVALGQFLDESYFKFRERS
jgi:hypothetical protein